MQPDSRASFPAEERVLLEVLDRIAGADTVRERIDAIVQRLEESMAEDRAKLMAWEPVPAEMFNEALPPPIRSGWVFVLRGGATTGAERHPNSHQRMMSYRGVGDLQTGGEGRWESHPLVSDANAGIERRWVSVPANVWHQAVVPVEDWAVVSFHTVAAGELIEERPDPADSQRTRQKPYMGS